MSIKNSSRFESLSESWQKAKLLSEREHVTPYIKKNPEIYKISQVLGEESYKSKRWCLDEEKDILFLEKIYQELYHKNIFFSMQDILKLLKKQPELELINNDIMRDEGYQKSLKNDKLIN